MTHAVQHGSAIAARPLPLQCLLLLVFVVKPAALFSNSLQPAVGINVKGQQCSCYCCRQAGDSSPAHSHSSGRGSAEQPQRAHQAAIHELVMEPAVEPCRQGFGEVGR